MWIERCIHSIGRSVEQSLWKSSSTSFSDEKCARALAYFPQSLNDVVLSEFFVGFPSEE